MINKYDLKRAMAESVGVYPHLPADEQTRDGDYRFSNGASGAFRVRVHQGKVASVTPWQDGGLLEDVEYVQPDVSQHPFVGLDLTEAVLRHMNTSNAPTSYERYSTG